MGDEENPVVRIAEALERIADGLEVITNTVIGPLKIYGATPCACSCKNQYSTENLPGGCG